VSASTAGIFQNDLLDDVPQALKPSNTGTSIRTTSSTKAPYDNDDGNESDDEYFDHPQVTVK
jgi:phosphoglycerol transferase MdoB-like AlkP superfamily enzyme